MYVYSILSLISLYICMYIYVSHHHMWSLVEACYAACVYRHVIMSMCHMSICGPSRDWLCHMRAPTLCQHLHVRLTSFGVLRRIL